MANRYSYSNQSLLTVRIGRIPTIPAQQLPNFGEQVIVNVRLKNNMVFEVD
jgi:hypothetical protein